MSIGKGQEYSTLQKESRGYNKDRLEELGLTQPQTELKVVIKVDILKLLFLGVLVLKPDGWSGKLTFK